MYMPYITQENSKTEREKSIDEQVTEKVKGFLKPKYLTLSQKKIILEDRLGEITPSGYIAWVEIKNSYDLKKAIDKKEKDSYNNLTALISV